MTEQLTPIQQASKTFLEAAAKDAGLDVNVEAALNEPTEAVNEDTEVKQEELLQQEETETAQTEHASTERFKQVQTQITKLEEQLQAINDRLAAGTRPPEQPPQAAVEEPKTRREEASEALERHKVWLKRFGQTPLSEIR